MLRQERVEDPSEALRLSLLGWQAGLWTAMPGILESFDKEKLTCKVQPAIKGKFRQKDGSETTVTMPLCLDVPVQFVGTQEFVLTFPMKEGDEGLIVFASRCIDAWWQNGDVQPQAELRMHDLSDGFFIPGFRSVPNVFENFNEVDAEFRNIAGDVKVVVREDELELVNGDDTSVLVQNGQIGMNAAGSTIVIKSGEISIDADTVKINGIAFETHKHTGVQAGGSNTGGPTS